MINSFKSFLVEEDKTVYFTFGRMNPPTIGHEKLLSVLAKKAGKNPYRIFLSHTEDGNKNPLESVDKYFEMKSRRINDKKLRYYDLSSMKIKIIDGVNIDKIYNDFFKIVSVDKYNKIHKTYTSMKLLDFTRYNVNATYAEKIGVNEDVELYNSDTIIYNIIYANKNKDKISL